MDGELDPRSRLREYVDSKRRLVVKELCYTKPTRSSWPLKAGRMGDLSQLKEDLEQNIPSCCYGTKMHKRSGFWEVDLTPNTQELLAFITPQGRCSSGRSCPLAWPTHLLFFKS